MFDSDDAVRDIKSIIDSIMRDNPNPPWHLSTDIAYEDITISTVILRLAPVLVAILQVAQNHPDSSGGITLSLSVEPVQRDEESLQ